MKSKAVIGLGFGDEGKGKVVSYLCSQSPNALVVRYSGGHQAGHHVMLRNGKEHVFSNFGCGTLQGNNTYWSQYCTVDPVGLLNELDALVSIGVSPWIFIHRDCPVTTPYEKRKNKELDGACKHGSCGVGFGQTIQRQQDHFSITVKDLFYPSILKIKLGMIRRHYYCMEPEDERGFLITCEEFIKSPQITVVDGVPKAESIIFEGSQGLLLDQSIGFFPHVTRSYTGTKNILEMGFSPEIFLVTRAYQTRHGNGPMTDSAFDAPINPYERNYDSGFQGAFRKSVLDIDMLQYAINSDNGLRNNKNISIVITCLDLMDGRYALAKNGQVKRFSTENEFVNEIKKSLPVRTVYLSRNPYPELEIYPDTP